ncbi:hypothetical protein KIPB_011249, partial [Kipferlia bialata]|eukprot:g11249.t1
MSYVRGLSFSLSVERFNNNGRTFLEVYCDTMSQTDSIVPLGYVDSTGRMTTEETDLMACLISKDSNRDDYRNVLSAPDTASLASQGIQGRDRTLSLSVPNLLEVEEAERAARILSECSPCVSVAHSDDDTLTIETLRPPTHQWLCEQERETSMGEQERERDRDRRQRPLLTVRPKGRK